MWMANQAAMVWLAVYAGLIQTGIAQAVEINRARLPDRLAFGSHMIPSSASRQASV